MSNIYNDENIKIYIEKLRPFAEDIFGNNSASHDINHLIRVMRTALYIQTKEGGDRFIIAISAFLHDIHRVIQNNENKYITPKESLPIVKEIIEKSKIDLEEEQLRQILFCIEHHEDKNWNGNNVNDINTLILQDADNIDAIGAIGIGRGFIYGNQYKQPQFVDNIPFEEFEGYEEKIKDVSLMHFFHNKLIKLGKNMNTETAKDIATERVHFVELFIDEFIKEWNAKF